MKSKTPDSLVIWTCWFRGEQDPGLPSINKLCIQAWKQLNPEYKVIVIDQDNIDHYAPEYSQFIAALKHERSMTSRSNLLRLLLLLRHGGIWADASVLPMLPVKSFLPHLVNETGFFTYRFFPRQIATTISGDRETVSWFLVSPEPGHFLIKEWLNRYLVTFLKSDRYTFFAIHQALCDLYDENPAIRKCVGQMNQISERIPHCLTENLLKDTIDHRDVMTISGRSFSSRSIPPHRLRLNYSFLYKRPMYADLLNRISISIAEDMNAGRPVSPVAIDTGTNFPARQMVDPLIGCDRDSLVQAFLDGVCFFDSQRPGLSVAL